MMVPTILAFGPTETEAIVTVLGIIVAGLIILSILSKKK